MKDEFRCKNCGDCCTDINTQINLTFLDLKMLCEALDKSASQLFRDGDVAFLPFANGEDLSLFDIEIGLNKPCRFYDGKLCKIYDLRPMNCRTFPYWILNHDIPNDLVCLQGIKLSKNNKSRYKAYEHVVGKTLIGQSEMTDSFLTDIGAKKTINLSADKEFQKLIVEMNDAKDVDAQKMITKKMIAYAQKKIDKKEYKKYHEQIEKEMLRKDYDKLIDSIIEADMKLDN